MLSERAGLFLFLLPVLVFAQLQLAASGLMPLRHSLM